MESACPQLETCVPYTHQPGRASLKVGITHSETARCCKHYDNNMADTYAKHQMSQHHGDCNGTQELSARHITGTCAMCA